MVYSLFPVFREYNIKSHSCQGKNKYAGISMKRDTLCWDAEKEQDDKPCRTMVEEVYGND